MKTRTLVRTAAALALPMLLATACGSGEDMSPSSESKAASNGVLVRSAAGWNEAAILDAVNAYRKDLGGENNLNAVGTQPQGHREINWDGVPTNLSAPNFFPGDGFKNRGLLMSSPGVKLQVSTRNGETTAAAPLFANLNAQFPHLFKAFSPEKLFAPVHSTITELSFTVPGSDTQATVAGFGAVFTDVDLAQISKIEYLNLHGQKLHVEWVKAVPGANKSLSFVGVSFPRGERVAKVRIHSGNVKLGAYQGENKWNDAVALDDFLYAEPQAVKQQPQW